VESYSLTVVAQDGGVPVRSGSLSVDIRVMSDVSDAGPRFEHVTYDVTVDENAPLMTVLTTARATSERRDSRIQYALDDDTTRRYGQVNWSSLSRLAFSALTLLVIVVKFEEINLTFKKFV